MALAHKEYSQRIADVQLREYLEAFGAVLIEGPRGCGKTATARKAARSAISLRDPKKRDEYLATASVNPSLLLKGDAPRLIAEWGDAPVLREAVRAQLEERRLPGRFILTGSHTVDRPKIRHSGTGRIASMSMLPMSLWESHESTGEISLRRLFDDPACDIEGKISKMAIEDLIFAAARGGWPAALSCRTPAGQLRYAKSYIRAVCGEDISRIDGRRRNGDLASSILRAYAHHVSSFVKNTELLEELAASGRVRCSADTLDGYLNALRRLFVIADLDACCPAIRNKGEICRGVKRGFCDPSIAVAALGLAPEELQVRLKTFGFIFEQMCIRDLKAYTAAASGHLSYYRDRRGLKADIVLHLNDGRYALIECMLGSREIEEGAGHLLELKRLIAEHNLKEKRQTIREPDLLLIITAGEIAYARQDGVKIIPLACLKD